MPTSARPLLAAGSTLKLDSAMRESRTWPAMLTFAQLKKDVAAGEIDTVSSPVPSTCRAG